MAKETVSIDGFSQAAPDVVWSRVQDFACTWHPMIDWMELESSKDGTVIRRFTVKEDAGYYREQLTYLSHSQRTMSYTCLEGIKDVKAYNATLSVVANDSGGSKITWQAEIEADGSRATEIAEGTGFIFKAGIYALQDLPLEDVKRESQIKKSSVPDENAIETIVVNSQPELAFSVVPDGLRQSDEICVFLHGIGGSRTNWHNQISSLASLAPMVALDLRGYGDSPLGNKQTTVEDYFDDILTVMARFKASKIILCGLSYGAWIATSFALSYPDKMAGLVLCGGCTGMSEAATEERDAFLASRETPLSAGKTPADFAAQVVEMISGPNASDAVRDQMMESMAQITVNTYRDALNCFCNPAGQFDFAALACPTLLMTGEHDRLAAPAEISQVAKRMHKATSRKVFIQYEMIADAGHVCNLENPDLFNSHLCSFLSRMVAETNDG